MGDLYLEFNSFKKSHEKSQQLQIKNRHCMQTGIDGIIKKGVSRED